MRRQELHPRTAVINKTQKSQSKNARNEALLWLAATFPLLFDSTECIRPLKTGIMEDILFHASEAAKVGISRSKLREAVVIFTRRIDYLACLKAREMRIDLNGSPVTPVTEEEAQRAALKIKKRVEKSIRNARKTMAIGKSLNVNKSFAENKMAAAKGLNREASYCTAGESNAYHIERASVFSMTHATGTPPKAAAVVVKHKTTRSYDPDAVARLKAKLGLARSIEEKEIVEH